VTPRSVAVGYQRFGRPPPMFRVHPKDGGSKVLRNVGVLPQHYAASQSRRPRFEPSPPGKPQISHSTPQLFPKNKPMCDHNADNIMHSLHCQLKVCMKLRKLIKIHQNVSRTKAKWQSILSNFIQNLIRSIRFGKASRYETKS